MLINFAYVTKIPCYKNNTDCFITCNPYSNDCLNCSDQLYDDSTSYVSKKPHVEFHQEIDDDLISNNSNNSKIPITIDSESTNGSDTIDELSNILRASDNTNAEDNDDASSKWSKSSYSVSSNIKLTK